MMENGSKVGRKEKGLMYFRVEISKIILNLFSDMKVNGWVVEVKEMANFNGIKGESTSY